MCIALAHYKITLHTQSWNFLMIMISSQHQSLEAQRYTWFDPYYTGSCFRGKFSMLIKCPQFTKIDVPH